MVKKKINVDSRMPLGWKLIAKRIRKGATPKDIRISGKLGDLSRFAARYRLALSIQEIKLDHYAYQTAEGYTGLFKVLSAYSALEQLMFALERGKPSVADNEALNHIYADQIRSVAQADRFITFLQSNTNNPKLQLRLHNFLHENSNDVLSIGVAVRHLFAHGPLTPNANECRPKRVRKILDLTYAYLMAKISGIFDVYVKSLPGQNDKKN